MKGRIQKGRESRGKALDLWQAPEGAGEPLACLATTFTFEATFFETDCLGRFLQMDSHPEESESVGYLIEREEKLSSARVCVLVDRRHAQTKESLRWDVLPLIIPNAALHAKLSILCWSNYIRVIIGSGNLTESGYRKNLEVFGCLNASKQEGGQVREIFASIDFLEEILLFSLGDDTRRGPKQRAYEILASLRTHIRQWPSVSSREIRTVPIFSGLGESIFSHLHDIWPGGSRPRSAFVLSPFFDRDATGAAMTSALSDILAKRRQREINFYFPYEDLLDGKTRLFAPKSIVDAATESCDVEVYKVLREQDGEPRSLHAKMLVLASDDYELWLIGSSNFTRAGFGLRDSAANLEANLAYIVRTDQNEFRTLSQVWPEIDDEAVDLNSLDIIWEPVFEEDGEGENVAVLPAGFREALYDAGSEPPRLILLLESELPSHWSIKVTDGEELLNSESWNGENGEYVMVWEGRPAPLILDVVWESLNGTRAAGWPVNIVEPSTLPPPDSLRGLALEELIEILSSTHPFHIAIIQTLKKRARLSSIDIQLDPHKRVNTETFLLRRTKRVAMALERLRERLERPVLNSDGLDWRLRGPVGAMTLAEAFQKEARTPTEARFFLAELALTLKRVDISKTASGGLSMEQIKSQILGCILEIERKVTLLAESSGSAVDRYVEEALVEAKR